MARISAINFTFFFFFLAILHLNVLSLKLTATGDKPFPLVAMEQNHDHDKSLEKKLIARVANEQREKSNKCSLCDYASSHAGHLRTHLKMHSGEKTNKCNLCDYTSFQARNLKAHLKMHSGEKTNKCNLCHNNSPQPAINYYIHQRFGSHLMPICLLPVRMSCRRAKGSRGANGGGCE